jgi:lysophospholipase L1-like esterase
MKVIKRLVFLLFFVFFQVAALASGVPEDFEKPENYPDPLRLKSEIDVFEWIDYVLAPTEGAVLAVGSSSIFGWHNRIHQDLKPLTIIPRGFGSSTMYDLLYYSDKIVLPYKPRAILVYEGDNDIAWGSSPEDVLKTFDAFVDKVHQALPDTRIYLLSIKPSISRAHLLPQIQVTNRLLQEACEANVLMHYIDITSPMLKDGEVIPKYINTDDLHMNATGYGLWRDIVQREMVIKETGKD